MTHHQEKVHSDCDGTARLSWQTQFVNESVGGCQQQMSHCCVHFKVFKKLMPGLVL
jgi:hypothetical protein